MFIKVYSLAPTKTAKGTKILKENFKSHIEKAGRARLISIFWDLQLSKNNNKSKGEEILLSVFQEMQVAKEINDYKNYSLYTSFFDDTYKTPREIITGKMVSVIRNLAKNRVVLVKQFVTIPSKQYEEMKTYAAEHPITNEDSDEEAVKFLKENVSIDFFEKLMAMTKKENSK